MTPVLEAVRRLLTNEVLVALGLFSALAFVLTLILVPLVLTRLSSDHYTRAPGSEPERRSSLGQWLALFARNFVGLLLVLLGALMLVLPGQGLLTLVLGLLLLDFPRKRQFELKILGNPRVLGAVNALRRRAGRAPLEVPGPDGVPPPVAPGGRQP